MTIQAQEAARRAAEYYGEISGDVAYRQEITVEEVEKDETHWLITLGFAQRSYSLNSPRDKDYKIFKVNNETGEIESMKIRTI
ncbi:hypothetical protein L3X65_11985 [Vibrio diabolicus]|uniref:hypothetical protein n=1 Tax=Vibrio diabolicus TaxID=50719 RepID=UPI00211B1AE2|nr:hypothetical protein [Vibrio diabolicus]MCG9229894.1 hypothetical protein [Vibrio diabolicus]MCG9572624.1 hypothetical protein [Vibrio diabolicus]MCG9593984.1 hypothetical protein [Vibrio diabolicus]MCG9776640.1 hypothetical protein [Vibrio diabolicus]